jgi:hypothetical protein
MELWESQARELIGQEFAPVLACDPVNAAMIRHWSEAMGHPFEWNEALEAPATMLQCWLFPGPTRERPPDSAIEDATAALKLFALGGYEAVVTVSTELDFARPLTPGDRLAYTSSLESIGEEKMTALGPGRFVGFRFSVRDADGANVGTIRFTNLVYRPVSGESQ